MAIPENSIKQAVAHHYERVADDSCGCSRTCCGRDQNTIATSIGYTEEELKAVPEGVHMGLGCGAPVEYADLRIGETVLDLGSGGGIDVFLAARKVGYSGTAIGVDMTAGMIARARSAAQRMNFGNVEFRLGELEHLPVADATIGVILSNCVINLVPAKDRVFEEAFRVLKAGGRIAFADIVATDQIPLHLASDVSAYAACVAGAIPVEETRRLLSKAGFINVRATVAPDKAETLSNDPRVPIARALILAQKPS